MIKRIFDSLLSLFGLIVASPILIPTMIAVWLQDYHSPFYMAPRVGRDGKLFRMAKLRSMTVDADKTGVNSTASGDSRITPVGHFIRRYKLDELSQLWNVLMGDMSLVGPRPQVQQDVAIYTDVEKRLLSVRPGITDISSIVFADEGEVLKGYDDPDLAYNQLIRPWKSRLGLLYIDNQSLMLDVRLLYLTVLTILSRSKALDGIQQILDDLGADEMLKQVAGRQNVLEPFAPPGATEFVTRRA